jgi:hypothetical protein
LLNRETIGKVKCRSSREGNGRKPHGQRSRAQRALHETVVWPMFQRLLLNVTGTHHRKRCLGQRVVPSRMSVITPVLRERALHTARIPVNRLGRCNRRRARVVFDT